MPTIASALLSNSTFAHPSKSACEPSLPGPTVAKRKWPSPNTCHLPVTRVASGRSGSLASIGHETLLASCIPADVSDATKTLDAPPGARKLAQRSAISCAWWRLESCACVIDLQWQRHSCSPALFSHRYFGASTAQRQLAGPAGCVGETCWAGVGIPVLAGSCTRPCEDGRRRCGARPCA